jgi:hypothetical protein
MKTQHRQEYKDAPYELSLLDANGKVIQEYSFGIPYRFNRPLTDEEWQDGLKNGFEKYSVTPLETVP